MSCGTDLSLFQVPKPLGIRHRITQVGRTLTADPIDKRVRPVQALGLSTGGIRASDGMTINGQHKLVLTSTIQSFLTSRWPGVTHLKPSTMLRSDDPQIIGLVEQALLQVGADAGPKEKAMALRRFVNDHVAEKDLSVGFATASEVARTGQGDCTEHAVLLAAMLRAEGIPSRVVSGLIYVDRFLGHRQVFGYHMWTQAWIAPAPRNPRP